MFPNQWYELAFPFLRMTLVGKGDMTRHFLELAFSPVLPALASLIPLGVYGYVFQLGGVDLSLTSVHQVIEAMMEQRLVERLDPANKNIREREEAALRVQRLIADQLIEEKRIAAEIREEVDSLRQEEGVLQTQVKEKEQSLAELQKQIETISGELEGIKTSRRTEAEKQQAQREIRHFLFAVVILPFLCVTLAILIVSYVLNALGVQVPPLIYVVIILGIYAWFFIRVRKLGESSTTISGMRIFKIYQRVYGILVPIATFLIGILQNASWDYIKSFLHTGP
jgi:hypothetical protein